MATVAIDNGGSGYTETGSGWNDLGAGYLSTGRYAFPDGGNGANTAKWLEGTRVSGQACRVSYTWHNQANLATGTPWQILDHDGTTVLASGTINQRTAPTGVTYNSADWLPLATVASSGTSLTLKISDSPADYTVADAALFEDVSTPDPLPTQASGNWNGNVWGGFATPTSENVLLKAGHDIVVNTTATAGDVTAEDTASLTIADGQSLTAGDVTAGNCVVQVGQTTGGATLTCGSLTIGGNNKSLSRLKARGTGNLIESTTLGTFSVEDGLYDVQGGGTFLNFGDASTDSGKLIRTSTGGGNHVLTGWLFDTCGRFNTQSTLPVGMGLTYSCRHINSPGDSARFTGLPPTGGVPRSINLSAFDGPIFFSEDAFTITNSVIDSEFSHGNTGTWADGAFDGNYVRLVTTSGGGIVGQTLRGDTNDCYFFADGGTDNPHIVVAPNLGAAAVADGIIIEYSKGTTTDEGNCILNSGGGDWTFLHLIVLPNPTQAGHAAGAVTFSGEGFTIEHSTLYAQPYGGGLLIGDTSVSPSVVKGAKSNLFWHDTAATGKAITAIAGAITMDDVVVGAEVTHNGLVNCVATAYEGSYPGTQPGANDVRLDSVTITDILTAPNRNIGTWAASIGCADPDYADRVLYARASLLADPLLIPDLMAHVRAGFAPKVLSLKDAGHDGVTIGAVEYVAPAPTGSFSCFRSPIFSSPTFGSQQLA